MKYKKICINVHGCNDNTLKSCFLERKKIILKVIHGKKNLGKGTSLFSLPFPIYCLTLAPEKQIKEEIRLVAIGFF